MVLLQHPHKPAKIQGWENRSHFGYRRGGNLHLFLHFKKRMPVGETVAMLEKYNVLNHL